MLCLFLFLLLIFDKGFLCRLGACPGTSPVDQAGLELTVQTREICRDGSKTGGSRSLGWEGMCSDCLQQWGFPGFGSRLWWRLHSLVAIPRLPSSALKQ